MQITLSALPPLMVRKVLSTSTEEVSNLQFIRALPCVYLLIVMLRDISVRILLSCHGATLRTCQGEIRVSNLIWSLFLHPVQSRNFVLDKNPPKPPPPPVAGNAQTQPKKRKGARSSKKATNKKRKVQDKRKAAELSEEEIKILSDSEDDQDIDGGGQATESQSAAPPRRSTRARRPIGASYRETDEDDIDMADDIAADVEEDIITQETRPAQSGTTTLPETSHTSGGIDVDSEPITIKDEETEAMTIEGSLTSTPGPGVSDEPQSQQTVIHIEDDEEPKPKLSLQLKYQGFQIHGHCLCVVVEPWPPIRSASRAPSLAPMVSTTIRAPSIAPPDFVPSGAAARRERTPLFLPDDDQDRGETPGPSIRRLRTLPPVPLFNDIPEEERQYDSDEDGGMMEFSQVLKTGGTMNGGVEEDDEYDGALFFADADEEREL